MIASQFIKWDKVTGYTWGKYQEKRWLNKEYRFFDLYIMKEHNKLEAKLLQEKEEKVKKNKGN